MEPVEARIGSLEDRVVRLERQLASLTEILELLTANPQVAAANDPAQDAELRRLITARNLIGATKHYRQLTGLGLVESKAAVEAITRTPEFAHIYPPKR